MTPEYRAQKEASVSNLGGGGIWEINYVTLIAPGAALLWAILQTRQSFFKPYTAAACLCDFLLQCATILFAITAYASAPQVLNGLLILPAVAAYLQPTVDTKAPAKPPPKSDASSEGSSSDGPRDLLPMKPFITTYRGAMMIITCISILAVDFNVFPRRFAKTENFGTSLMDLGVGSFVFAAGLVAARQQLKEERSKAPSFVARMKAAMRHSLPLLLLGFFRLWSVKGLDYVEHVSEYGVHWNFFFTLSLLPPAIALLQPVLRFTPSYCILAFIIALCYELALFMIPDLKVYILLSERRPDDWLSQNREGVYSFAGYLAIFIAGMGTGRGILPRDFEDDETMKNLQEKDALDEDEEWLSSVLGQPTDTATPTPNKPKAKSKVKEQQLGKPQLPKMAIVFLARWGFIWFVLSVWALWIYGPRLVVSRRMANLAYVVWVCAFNTIQLLLFCGIENTMFPGLYVSMDKQTERRRARDATSRIMQAFNRNGLALFLLANLLTGLVNLTLPTLYMGEVASMSILLAYIAVLTGVGLAMDHYDVSLKL